MAKTKHEYSFECILLIIFGIFTFSFFLISSKVPDAEKNNWIAGALLCLGIFLNNLFILAKNSIKIFNDLYNDLYGIGVLKSYSKRKDSETEGYLHDLLEDFSAVKKLNKWHSKKNEPIKILGLALGKHLLETKIAERIEENCKNIDFHLLFCKEDNKELESRLRFVNGKFGALTKEPDWSCSSFKETPLFSELIGTKNKIETLKQHIHSLKARQYSFSPFATIIVINDHIYYTPNVLEYLNYVHPSKLPPEFNKYIYETELSLCIHRKSEFGTRLEKLFESLWENKENTILY